MPNVMIVDNLFIFKPHKQSFVMIFVFVQPNIIFKLLKKKKKSINMKNKK